MVPEQSQQPVHALWRPRAGPEAVPTLFAIHGHGAHAMDLMGLAPYLAGGRVQVICPEAEFVLQPGMPSYTWFHRDAEGNRPPEEFERVAASLSGFIEDATERYRADRERTAVLGFSQGGSLAYRLGLAEPSRFAGIAALSTWLPDEAVEAASEDREALAALPVLVQHGTEDPMVRIDRGRDSKARLEALGVRLEYHEYPMQHQIAAESLQDLSAWLERVLRIDPAEA
ncbi:MAG: phospholipase [Dehalococcoidia bacterium]|nr:phospholipase [Dehalococcoidia bacterium]